MTADGSGRAWRRRAIAALLVGTAVGALVTAAADRRPVLHAVLDDVAVRGAYVANPGMGWQDTRRRPAFAQSVEYIRPTGGWARLNPGQGVYDWSVIDRPLHAAQARGHLLSLRIYTMRHPDNGGHKVPQWVLDDGAVLIRGEPDYANAVYLRHWGTFVDALRARYDGHPGIAFIDISGYGNYNEWSWQRQTAWETDWRRPKTLDGQARTRLADMFLGGSGTARARRPEGGVTTVRYRYRGFRETQLVMPYAGIRQSLWYALARRRDVGWRFDCLGQISAEQLRDLGHDALQRWRRAPMVYEFCSDVDWSRARRAVDLTHPVLLHDNDTHADRARRLLAGIGYRYVLDGARWPRVVGPGREFTLQMWWRNDGSSPAYERFGVTPALRVGLLDPDGTVVHTWSASGDVGGWLPYQAPHEVVADISMPAGVTPGRHTLAVAIVDTGSGRRLALPMREAGADRWYPLGSISIGPADG